MDAGVSKEMIKAAAFHAEAQAARARFKRTIRWPTELASLLAVLYSLGGIIVGFNLAHGDTWSYLLAIVGGLAGFLLGLYEVSRRKMEREVADLLAEYIYSKPR